MAKKESKDRLEEAVAKKVETHTIDGVSIQIHKWTLKQGLKHSARLFGVIMKATTSLGSFDKMLQEDLADLLSANEKGLDLVIFVCADTLATHSGKDVEHFKKWIEELAPEHFLELLQIIVRMNVRPLVSKFSEIKAQGGLIALTKMREAV